MHNYHSYLRHLLHSSVYKPFSPLQDSMIETRKENNVNVTENSESEIRSSVRENEGHGNMIMTGTGNMIMTGTGNVIMTGTGNVTKKWIMRKNKIVTEMENV
jgi:hypothetical protein